MDPGGMGGVREGRGWDGAGGRGRGKGLGPIEITLFRVPFFVFISIRHLVHGGVVLVFIRISFRLWSVVCRILGGPLHIVVVLGSLLSMCWCQSFLTWVWTVFVAGWWGSLSNLLLWGGDWFFNRSVSREVRGMSKAFLNCCATSPGGYLLLRKILFNVLNSSSRVRGSDMILLYLSACE